MSKIDFILSLVEHEASFITSRPGHYVVFFFIGCQIACVLVFCARGTIGWSVTLA